MSPNVWGRREGRKEGALTLVFAVLPILQCFLPSLASPSLTLQWYIYQEGRRELGMDEFQYYEGRMESEVCIF